MTKSHAAQEKKEEERENKSFMTFENSKNARKNIMKEK